MTARRPCDDPKVWRIYRRGEEPWEEPRWDGPFDAYQYVATTKHVPGVHPGCAFEFDYFHTLREADAAMRRMMRYPWRRGEVYEPPTTPQETP